MAGVIGFPLHHSISPPMQQAAFDHLGLAVIYKRWETPAEALERQVRALRGPEMLGANVTVPHKERVIPLLDELDGVAAQTGAVNTIVNSSGRLIGYNTDVSGFLRALREDGAFEPRGRRALVLGAGGAARAVAMGLLQAGASAIGIANRTPAKAEALLSALRKASPGKGTEVFIVPWGAPAVDADLIVNTTPMGMLHSGAEGDSPLRAAQIPKRALVFDLVYNPPETRLLREAAMAGARTLGGLPMLVYQGAAAFELWTKRKAPLEIMRQAAEEALK